MKRVGKLGVDIVTMKEFQEGVQKQWSKWKKEHMPPKRHQKVKEEQLWHPKDKKTANIEPLRMDALLARGAAMW